MQQTVADIYCIIINIRNEYSPLRIFFRIWKLIFWWGIIWVEHLVSVLKYDIMYEWLLWTRRHPEGIPKVWKLDIMFPCCKKGDYMNQLMHHSAPFIIHLFQYKSWGRVTGCSLIVFSPQLLSFCLSCVVFIFVLLDF